MFSVDPPGLDFRSTPRALWNRHLLTLGAYAALSPMSRGKGEPGHKLIRDEIPIHLRGLALGSKGDQIAQCYRSGRPVRECLDLAVSLGVVPRFEDYIEEVERVERETGMAASCRIPH
jgi:hypothetical protein